MRRRTKRVRLNPRPFIVLGLLVNVVAGVALSPVTAVRRVRVEGAPEADRKRLTDLLQSLKNVPCARVDARSIESRALENPELRGASLARTPFGSAVLRVARREAVARLFGSLDTGLSADGVLYPATELPEDLPTVRLPLRYPSVGLTLGNAWRTQDVAHLATLVRGLAKTEPARIDLFPGGKVCLNIDSGIVDLGRLERLDEKIDRFRRMFSESPNLFATVKSVNLVRVEAPQFIPRPQVPPSHESVRNPNHQE